jgi:hypothetical protein
MTGPRALCPATLVHWHGTATCRHAPGHTVEHLGTCWSCVEDSEDSDLEWTEMHEDGTVPRG